MNRRINNAIKFAIIAIGGLLLIASGLKGIITGLLPAKDLYNTDWDNLKAGQHVEVYLDFVIEPFEETTKDNKAYSRLYTVPDLWTSSETGGIYMAHYMGVKVDSSQFTEYDSLVNESWRWWDDETGTVELGENGVIYVDGTLKKMSKSERQYLYNYLTDFGYTESDAEAMITPYVLVSNGTLARNAITVGLGAIITLVFGALAAIFFIRRN